MGKYEDFVPCEDTKWLTYNERQHADTEYMHILTLCIRETPKWVLKQTVKNQMKRSIMRHFVRSTMLLRFLQVYGQGGCTC